MENQKYVNPFQLSDLYLLFDLITNTVSSRWIADNSTLIYFISVKRAH